MGPCVRRDDINWNLTPPVELIPPNHFPRASKPAKPVSILLCFVDFCSSRQGSLVCELQYRSTDARPLDANVTAITNPARSLNLRIRSGDYLAAPGWKKGR
jgi:hypothetical protein